MSKLGFSWSWRRATGVSTIKQRIARATGIPTTRSGRERKIGRMLGAAWWAWLIGDATPTQPVEQEHEPERYCYEKPRPHTEAWLRFFCRRLAGVCLMLASVVGAVVSAAAYLQPRPDYGTAATLGTASLLVLVLGVWAARKRR